MEYDKINKILKIFIILLSITLAIATPISILTYNQTEKIKENDCIKKGNICTIDEIFDGVEVKIEVSKGKTYIFNVIANDENSMTLLMNKNIKKTNDWHSELINIYGPQLALINLLEKTKNWTNIKPIESFEYIDEGKISFENNCKNPNMIVPGYDCSNSIYKSRGYNSLKIINGVVTISANTAEQSPNEEVDNEYILKNYTANARLLTMKEYNELVKDYKYPSWLKKNLGKNEGYWTLTSSTSLTTGYQQGAIAIVKADGEISVESAFVQELYQPNFEIGIRPVITLEKK